MKWSILILTQPSREEYLTRLLDILRPQVEAVEGVEIVVSLHDKSKSVGECRQLLRESCAGEYSNFIDDDDIVSDSYISKILPLLDGVDYVGHLLQRYDDGVPQPSVFEHSIKYPFGSNSPHSTGHINPIKTSVALKARMQGGFGEDRRWWADLAAMEAIQTEHFIPEVLYQYWYRSQKSDGA